MVAGTAFRYSHTVGQYAFPRGPGFLNPVDMVVGPDGVVYVVSRGHNELESQWRSKRITMANVEGDFLGEFGIGGPGDGQLMWPSSIAMDSEQMLYVSDEALQRVTIMDNRGQFIGKWGARGSGDGEFDRPASLAFDQAGYLLVVDGLNHRVQRYTKDGRFLGSWGRQGTGPGEFNIPWGITVDDAGDVYVADWRNDRIQKFDPDGRHLASWGTSGKGDGQFDRPSGVAVDREGYVYVADRSNERVQVLDPEGRYVAKFRGEAGFSKLAQEWFAASNEDLKAEWDAANLEPELDPAPNDFLSYQSGSIIKLFWAPHRSRLIPTGGSSSSRRAATASRSISKGPETHIVVTGATGIQEPMADY